MSFQFTGKHILKKGMQAPSLKEFIEHTYRELQKPLSVPPYATAGESERIAGVTERLSEQPFVGRTAFSETARSFGALTPVNYSKYPLLYEICFHAHRVLNSPVPVLFVYEPGNDKSLVYQAMAVDYMQAFYLYISQNFLQEPDMASPEELCYLIGHELGHTQCHHTTLRLITKSRGGSNAEYSADRAGLLVAASWLKEKHPDWTLAQVADCAVKAGGTILNKIDVAIAHMLKKSKMNWSTYDTEGMHRKFQALFDNPSTLQPYEGTHPTDEHRVVAMHRFACSEKFYRLMGEEPIHGLYSDALLEEVMKYHIKAEKEG